MLNLKKMFSSPFYWIGVVVCVIFGAVIGASDMPPIIVILITFIVAVITGFLSAKVGNHERN